MSMSLLYRQPQLLDRHQHRGKRFKRVPSLSASAVLNACFLTAGEFAEASKEYVIAFVGGPAGPDAKPGTVDLSPVVLLGLRDAQNLFVDDSGGWDARYVPAFLRRYPFAYAMTASGERGVMIDAAWDGFQVTGDDGEPLIQADGEPTPFLAEMIGFLDAFEEEADRTHALCKRIVELDLLKPVQIDVRLPDGSSFNAGGLQMVDEARLKALPEAVVLELLRNGALGLLYAHLISTGNVQRLTERFAARAPVPATAANDG